MAGIDIRHDQDIRRGQDRDRDVSELIPRPTSAETALQGVATARDRLAVAKQTHSSDPIAAAERDLQTAIDRAREFDVRWGLIGGTLGIARGNAYQRYRKRPDGYHAHGTRWQETA